MEECERVNEDFSQSHNSSINIDQNHHSNNVDSSDDQLETDFDHRSPSSSTSQAADETCAPENEDNMYVVYL